MTAKHGTGYTLAFVLAVCLVCAVLVSLSAVMLKDLQEANKQLDRQKNVLSAAGLIQPGEKVTQEEVLELFDNVVPLVIDFKTGKPTDMDPEHVDMRLALIDDSTSFRAEPNAAMVQRLPNHALVYQVIKGGEVQMVIIPVNGKGLWSTLYGFLALDTDTATIKGVSFYEHAETPGLGGEIDNPNWTSRWIGRKVFDEAWDAVFQVKKGAAGTIEEDPHSVDGLSGATLTGNGVEALVNFWVGEQGYGPFLENFRKGEI